MTAISGTNASASALASWAGSVKASQTTANDTRLAATETWVSLGENMVVESGDRLYDSSLSSQRNLAWSFTPTDDLSQLMFRNISTQVRMSSNQAPLLSGVGAALLERFTTTSSNFKQSVVDYQGLSWDPVGDPTSESYQSTDVTRTSDVEALAKAQNASNRVNLTLKTASGDTVNIALVFGGNSRDITSSLSVEVNVVGTLDDAEKAAVAALSSGFEKMLQSIGTNASSIDVSGLVDYDESVLSNVDLSVSQGAQLGVDLKSLEFHADAKGRSLSVQRKSGNFALEVDFSRAMLLGSAEQQQNAVNRYLQQFDADNQRGHGDSTRMKEFKTAFTQLNSGIPGTPAASSGAAHDFSLDYRDRSVISGLADFKATLSNDFTHNGKSGFTIEAGHLDYQVSQKTTVLGRDKYSGISVTQVQNTRLKSVFATSRNEEMLDTEKGNYNLTTITDETSVETTFAYAKNKLLNASVQRLVSQLEKFEEFVDHKLVSERETPVNESTVEDISAWLRPLVETERV